MRLWALKAYALHTPSSQAPFLKVSIASPNNILNQGPNSLICELVLVWFHSMYTALLKRCLTVLAWPFWCHHSTTQASLSKFYAIASPGLLPSQDPILAKISTLSHIAWPQWFSGTSEEGPMIHQQLLAFFFLTQLFIINLPLCSVEYNEGTAFPGCWCPFVILNVPLDQS